MTDAEWDAKAELITSRLGDFERNRADNAVRLAEIVADVRRRTRMAVVATVLPVNPRFVAEVLGDQAYAAMSGKVLAMVEAERMPLADLGGAGLVAEDYWDWIHLRSAEVRGRTTDILAETVRQALDSLGGSP